MFSVRIMASLSAKLRLFHAALYCDGVSPSQAASGTVAKLAMRQPFVYSKALHFKTPASGAFRGDPAINAETCGLCVVTHHLNAFDGGVADIHGFKSA